MALEDGRMTIKAWDGNVALEGTDKDLVVQFHKGTRINPLKSKETGAPVYDQVDFMKVIHPGEPLNVYDQPVREQDKWRFKPLWDAYQANADQKVSGTPLSVLFPHHPEIVKSLGAVHIVTVQQLANMSDTAKQNIMFGMNLSEMAKQYLSVAEKGAEFHALQAKLEELAHQNKLQSEQIEILKNKPQPKTDDGALAATVASLAAAVAQLQAPPEPKRRGRPPGSTRKPQESPQTDQPAA